MQGSSTGYDLAGPAVAAPGAGVTSSPAAGVASNCRGWIESRAYDLTLFTLSPLAGLLIVALTRLTRMGTAAGVLAVYFVGIPHYLSTFTFYLGDQNRDHYRLRWAAFFLGPLIIFAFVLTLRVLDVTGVVQSVIFTWNIYHVSQQSAGFLSLYRRLNAGNMNERRWAQITILSVNATMAFWFLKYFPPLYDLLLRVHAWAPAVLRYGCLAAAVIAASGYAFHLLQRPQPVGVPECAFLISSLLMFHPYLWLQDYVLATIAMLMGHFIQYLGIVWLLNRRKYSEPTAGSRAQQWLVQLSSRPRLLLICLAVLGGAFLFIDRGSRHVGMYTSYIIALNSLVLIHFYVDGLVWAFKDRFVRDTVGSYLVLKSHQA